MNARRFVLWWAAVLCCVALGGAACTATSLAGRKADDLSHGAFGKVVGLGFFNAEKDRKVFERRVAQALFRKGCKAVPSLEILEYGVEYGKEGMEDIVLRHGVDAVLILRISDVQPARTRFAERYSFSVEPDVYSWFPYWMDGMGLMVQGGYHERRAAVHVESALFSMETGNLVWVGQSDTKRVRSVAALAGSVGSVVARQLRKDGLIP